MQSEPNPQSGTPSGSHPGARIGASVLEFDCSSELRELRAGDSYRSGDHAASTLVKQGELRVVLVALKPGGRMDEHQTDALFTVQVLDGRVEVDVAGERHVVAPGRVLVIARGLSHSILGLDESAILLTLAGFHAEGG